jgi:hypothetical protein
MTFCKRPLADAKEVIVVQLQLLDLMIRRECDAVSLDAATRVELIGLMARVVVAVFHAEGEAMTEVVYSPKIKPEHLARKAIVYLRQSSERQVRQKEVAGFVETVFRPR